MYKNVLIPVLLDDSQDYAATFDVARAIGNADAQFTLLHVMEAVPAFVRAEIPTDIIDDTRVHLSKKLEQVAKKLRNAIPLLVTGHAGRTIVDHAQEHGTDCIIVASHKPGLEDYFLGSTAARVVRHAPCAVHVIR